NADFDGDEMNLHVLQGEEARGEARILMRVQEHILSPRFGGPVMGGIHDHISGLFLLTYKDRKFSREAAMRIISGLGRFIELPEPKKDSRGGRYWAGKQLFSLIIPEGLNMEYKASICEMCEACKKEKCEFDAYVVVRDGKLITGTVDGKSVSAFKGKMLDKIIRDYGLDRARQFINEIGLLGIVSITNIGFTTGIEDEDIPEDARKEIEARLLQAEKDVDKVVEAYNEGRLDPLPGRTVRETLEVTIMRYLGEARDDAGKIAGRHLGMNNSAVIMARSGARGSMLNLSQMAGTIGQQAVRGERIQRGYAYRTLPHFKKGDLGADSRGFVKASYKSGLSPTEYFFHSMGGREGLVDTAVRTSRSGYMQRRLINALEDLRVDYDSTVRNTSGEIIQFSYGEDGIDPTRSIGSQALDIDTIINEVRRGD
ncbi:MAG: DNA-directed RNA polymerase subunit A', partial [Thermoplasmata archaeon]|nr:DNA-directed RNA polymerase subunit A' [Thermoplasmata archaeon]